MLLRALIFSAASVLASLGKPQITGSFSSVVTKGIKRPNGNDGTGDVSAEHPDLRIRDCPVPCK